MLQALTRCEYAVRLRISTSQRTRTRPARAEEYFGGKWPRRKVIDMNPFQV